MLLTIPASIKDSNWRITARGKANDCHGRRKPICRNRSREAWSQNLPLRPSMRSLNKADSSVCLLLWRKLWKSESTLIYADPRPACIHHLVICVSSVRWSRWTGLEVRSTPATCTHTHTQELRPDACAASTFLPPSQTVHLWEILNVCV